MYTYIHMTGPDHPHVVTSSLNVQTNCAVVVLVPVDAIQSIHHHMTFDYRPLFHFPIKCLLAREY